MIFLISICIIVLVGVVGYFYWRSHTYTPEPQPIPPDPLEPSEPETKTVVKELQPQEIKKKIGRPFYLANLFVPELLWSSRISSKQRKELLDTYVTKEAGNSMRVFLFSQCWGWKYCKWNLEPFRRDDNGKYIMPQPYQASSTIGNFINVDWESKVIEVINDITERKITVIISLWDNCGFHRRSNSAWGRHFLNPSNSYISLSSKNYAYYLYADQQQVDQEMKNTGKVVEAMTEYMLRQIWNSLNEEQKKYVTIELCNEGQAGQSWHDRMYNVIREALGGVALSKYRLFTSTAKRIRDKFTPVIHQVGTVDRYTNKVPSYVCGISTDGYRKYDESGNRIPIDTTVARKILTKTFDDGHILFEDLHGHCQDHVRLPKAGQFWYDFSAIRWDSMQVVADRLREKIETQ